MSRTLRSLVLAMAVGLQLLTALASHAQSSLLQIKAPANNSLD
jgi:hypothetical protein